MVEPLKHVSGLPIYIRMSNLMMFISCKLISKAKLSILNMFNLSLVIDTIKFIHSMK